ncbi:hypothetical protein HK405_011729, partial [Cladochytrium tenue]
MGDVLPSEVLEAILLWLHPHEVIRLQRLSRANARAVEALHVDVLFALKNLEINRAVLGRRPANYARLPLSYTIALFINDGCSRQAILTVAEDQSWFIAPPKVSDSARDRKVTAALRHIFVDRPERFTSWGLHPWACLSWAATVGDLELTRLAVKRAVKDFRHDSEMLNETLNRTLAGAFRSGEQAVIDCVLDQCEMEPTAYAMTWVALQPNVNLVRSFIRWYSQKFYHTPSWNLNGAVFCAASLGHLDVMNYLLTLHSEQETIDQALAFAGEEGRTAVCERLMTAGADPRFERMRALCNAIKNEHVQVIELFVRDPRVKIALELG